MPSPFPGMDPFIESQRWRDFHTRFITVLGELLTPLLRPQYVVDVEEYVYLAREGEPPDRVLDPYLSIRETELVGAGSLGRAQSTLGRHVTYTLPMTRRVPQAHLAIRYGDHEIVTVIELLSPTNKSAGDGRTEYLVKRTNIFHTPASLVELDLLRGGLRLPRSSRCSRPTTTRLFAASNDCRTSMGMAGRCASQCLLIPHPARGRRSGCGT